MFCLNCGKQIPDGSKFCPYCGAKIEVKGKPELRKTAINRGLIVIPIIVLLIIAGIFVFTKFFSSHSLFSPSGLSGKYVCIKGGSGRSFFRGNVAEFKPNGEVYLSSEGEPSVVGKYEVDGETLTIRVDVLGSQYILKGTIQGNSIIFDDGAILNKYTKTNVSSNAQEYTQKETVAELIPYRKGDKWGFCDRDKNILIQPIYDLALYFSEGLAPVEIDGKWGFIDTKGNMVTQPVYDSALYFSEGLAPVEIDGNWGFIDTKGNIAIQPVYDGAHGFYKGIAPVMFDSGWVLIDKKENILLEINYAIAGDISYGLACVRLDDKYGFIDTKGNLVIPAIYDGQSVFLRDEGLARVKYNGKWGFIDTKGTQYWED